MSAVNEPSASLFQARLNKALEPLHNGLKSHPVYRRLSLQQSPAPAPAPANDNHAHRAAQVRGRDQSGEHALGTAFAHGLDRTPPTHAHASEDVLLPLRTFMEAHVFAVWDFMSLLKTLQQRLTCVRTPWYPPADPISARLINEIVLVEESDEYGEGCYASHFELYLTAMEEVGANTRPIRALLAALRGGTAVAAAMARTNAHPATKAFAMNTMATLSRSTHEVAASFLLGRESVIPLMFEQVLNATAAMDAPTFLWYLKRHIEVDGDEHGPAGWRLLSRLCGTDATRWQEAEASAKRALYARRGLWDGVCSALDLRMNAAAAG